MHFTYKKLIGNLSLISALTVPALAMAHEHYIVAPQCLLKNADSHVTRLSSKQQLVLIKTDETGLEDLIAAKASQKTKCGGFINVTHAWDKYHNKAGINSNYSTFLTNYVPTKHHNSFNTKSKYKIRYKQVVQNLLPSINPAEAWTNLTTLTAFPDRYADSDNGVAAADWFAQQMKDLATKYNRSDISVRMVKTGSYKQPSVVVKIGDSNLPGVVVGAHMDTLSQKWEKQYGIKPGADDDGSGSVTALETARTIIASGIKFKKPLYFVWYAAEEEGLIGSQYVVDDFAENKIAVDAVIHFDMTGYAYHKKKTLWLMDDYVNEDLTAFLQTLIKTYVKRSVGHSECGYACSDHASWTDAGIASAFPFETEFGHDNPYIHSSNDVMGNLSLTHIVDYVKLGVSFAVEMAEPEGN